MSYTITFKNQAVDPTGKAPITVPVGSVNSTSTSLSLTGKGAANFGKLQQENLIRLLESFADTTAPTAPTVGQLWYDSAASTLKVLTDASPQTWKSLGGIQVTAAGANPAPAVLGDFWYERTGSGSGILYVYTGLGRYPTTDTTIGGWEQVYPNPEVYGGREEYDSVRELLDRVCGVPVSVYGSGAIGRSISNLTNFAALDNDLRAKAKALAADTNVLYSPSSGISIDRDITRQTISRSLFYFADSGTPGDGFIAGGSAGTPDISLPGSIWIDNTSVSVPVGGLSHSQPVDDAFILWDQTNTLLPGTKYFVVQQSSDGQWQFDNNTAWVNFTPTALMYIIGTISSIVDTNSVYPNDKSAFVWASAVPMISTTAKYEHLKVQPNSQDWDVLLAAAKYALNRLEVPASFVRAISALPFVYDGRQVHSSLVGLDSSTDVRYPSAARRSNQHPGTVTMVSNFAETVNALNTAVANKFSLRGINGATGTNTSFASTVVTSVHAPSSSAGLSNILVSGSGDARVQFRFSSMAAMTGFLGAGGVIQVEVTHVGGATSADTNLRALLTAAGTWRLTGDKVRVFGQSLPLTITQPNSSTGLQNAVGAGVLLKTVTIGSCSLSMYAYRVSNTQFDVLVSVLGGGVLSGTTGITFKLITDDEVYTGSTKTYDRPLAFVAGDVVNSL